LAIIYSIVKTIEPGTRTSSPAGRFEVNFVMSYSFGGKTVLTEDEAREIAISLAESYQKNSTVKGINFTVEEVDEMSPLRAPSMV